ncbi:GNAT family protein [uncultured Cytophaga sp.]|uniref:GNAT family N-acetyltransferase n=1 Tax=uncultured Cytophaga sp. TaxID=160238 RepID=UPI00262C0206|nr:GNAT family protein [uncultured Cytophaga sp.]
MNPTSFPTLHTERLDLIEITQEHVSDLFALFGNEKVVRFYNLLPFKNESEGNRIIELFQTRFTNQTGIRWGIALKNTTAIIGTIGYNSYTTNHKATIGYDIQADFWNKGFVTEALQKVIDYGFNELQINRIEAEVMQGNFASEKVLTKLNFEKEGVLRDWMHWNEKHYDMTLFALLRKDFDINSK